jgi:hypothetical protein
MNESGKCYRHPLANPIVGKTREGIRQVDIDSGKRGEEYLLRRRVNGATSIAIPSATEPSGRSSRAASILGLLVLP